MLPAAGQGGVVTGGGPATVLLVDDHPLVRQGLQAVLSTADDITVVGEASDGRAAVELAADLEPDVIIMDLQLPGLHGIDATREIVAARPGTAVLVLTMFEDDDMVFSAVSAGAAGYLLKGAAGADIVTAVRAAAAGQAVFGAALAHRLRTWFTRGPQKPAQPFPQLTAREREILDGVAAGLTNTQIGQQMFLSAKTVANNVSNILAKLQLAERGQAIVAARDAGLGRQPHGEPESS
jgi:DNA-binding NarL/FixJ family response regulator